MLRFGVFVSRGKRAVGRFAIGALAIAQLTASSNAEPNELLADKMSAKSSLQRWRSGNTLDKLDRGEHDVVDEKRRVLVVIGITGGGKSSTANTLAGKTYKQFNLSNSVTSVTQSVTFRDYDFVNEAYRIIDTPGLCDTNKDASEVHGELERIARYSPHGISAFIVVVPRGRFTAEQEYALRELVNLFGDQMAQHAIVAVTSATDPSEGRNLLPRDLLIEEINQLPLNHFYRRFVEQLRLRVVPVENRIEPHRQISRMMLHQRVLDLEDANKGARYDSSQLLTRKLSTLPPLVLPHTSAPTAHFTVPDVSLSHNANAASVANGNATASSPPLSSSLPLGQCSHRLGRRPTDGRLTMTLECVVLE